MSKKSSTFAPAFEKRHYILPNCVMVALQILVLSVWVRVLVRQHKKVSCWGLFFANRLKPRGSYLTPFERLLTYVNSRVLVLSPKGHDYFGNIKKTSFQVSFFVREWYLTLLYFRMSAIRRTSHLPCGSSPGHQRKSSWRCLFWPHASHDRIYPY